MDRRFRRFLLLLLVFTLPVQAFASAAMLGRVAAHRAPVPHHAMVKMLATADASMATCHATEPAVPASHEQDCQHCPLCCLASSVLIPAIHPFQTAPAAQAVLAHADAVFIGHIPDGPERPPRTALA